MNIKEQEALISKVEGFLRERFGKDEELVFRTGEDAVQYSEYASKDHPWLAIDGSSLYGLLNYGDDAWEFKNAFDEFLRGIGFFFQLGYAWDITFYEI